MALSDDELAAWLAQDESQSRPYRARRLRLLLEEYGPTGIRIFPGGFVSAMAFEEARQAYLHGLFVACTIMCQVCVEHMLVGLFRLQGRDDLDRASFQKLLAEALDKNYITSQEYELFEHLRTMRNPYTHYRSPQQKDSLERRAITADSAVEDLVVKDAESAITALLRLCQRAPFALSSDDS